MYEIGFGLSTGNIYLISGDECMNLEVRYPTIKWRASNCGEIRRGLYIEDILNAKFFDSKGKFDLIDLEHKNFIKKALEELAQ